MTKHKRTNSSTFQKARRLVDVWYREQLRENRVRYLSDAREAAIRSDASSDPAQQQQKWDKPLTARGTETRVAYVQLAPKGESTDPFARGTYEHDHYIDYVRQCMAHVMALGLEAHKALEMSAAGWDLADIADSLGCSQHRAQTYLHEGLCFVASYQALRKPG